jgi:phosphonate transport system substrate-binding protein
VVLRRYWNGPIRRSVVSLIAAAAVLALGACGAPSSPATAARVLTISAIRDQDPQVLARLYGDVSTYLTEQLGVEVRYQPVTDY